jgi:aldose 1-epimerase
MTAMTNSDSVDYPRYTLSTGDGRCQLELLPEHGGIVNRLVLTLVSGEQVNVIAGFTSLEAIEQDAWFRGVPLYPFANRLQDGRYIWQGESYQLEVNETARNNALHGFLLHINPSIVPLEQSEMRASVRLDYDYPGNIAGYPFPALISMTYSVEADGALELDISVTNKHTHAAPLGTGWHPYFQLGGSVDQLSLQLPSAQRVDVDARLLPTGNLSAYTEFAELKPIGDTQFDTCFHVSDESINASKTQVIICAASPAMGLELWQETGEGKFNFIQVCIPPDRQSIAIEPVSCGINAFNTKHGLVTLAPGEVWSAKCGVRLIQQ